MAALQAGFSNLEAHIEALHKYGVPIVVTLNSFVTDTPEEIQYIENRCRSMGCSFALSEVWAKGGEGGIALAKELLKTMEEKESHYHSLYSDEMPLEKKIATVAKEVYGADGVSYAPGVRTKLKSWQNWGMAAFRSVWRKRSILFPIILRSWDGPRASKSTFGMLTFQRVPGLLSC